MKTHVIIIIDYLKGQSHEIFDLRLFSINQSHKFLGTARSRNTNVSAFVTAVKATVKQKKTIGGLAYPNEKN
jgi:hypothetical protein